MYFMFASESGAHAPHHPDGRWRSVRAESSTWEELRYRLEVQLCIHPHHHANKSKFKSKKKSNHHCQQTTCLVAMFYDAWVDHHHVFKWAHVVKGDETVAMEARLVLFRKPVPVALRSANPYVPPTVRLQQQQEEEAAAPVVHTTQQNDEDAWIHSIAGSALSAFPTRHQQRDRRPHPSDVSYTRNIHVVGPHVSVVTWVPVPPPGYACFACGVKGEHYRTNCPIVQQEDNNGGNQSTAAGGGGDQGLVPLDRVRKVTGIPRSFLQKVDAETRGSNALKDDHGNFYVIKQPRFPTAVLPPPTSTPRTNKHPPTAPAAGGAKDTVGGQVPLFMDTTAAGVNIMADFLAVSFTHPDPWHNISPPPHPPLMCPPAADAPPSFCFEASIRSQDVQTARDTAAFYQKHPEKRHKKQETCTHWLQGLCVKGELHCSYLHSAQPHLLPVCSFFVEGHCFRGTLCPFRHDDKKQPAGATTRLCKPFLRGFCPQGPTCSFTHVKRARPDEQQWVDAGMMPREKKRFRALCHTVAFSLLLRG